MVLEVLRVEAFLAQVAGLNLILRSNVHGEVVLWHARVADLLDVRLLHCVQAESARSIVIDDWCVGWVCVKSEKSNIRKSSTLMWKSYLAWRFISKSDVKSWWQHMQCNGSSSIVLFFILWFWMCCLYSLTSLIDSEQWKHFPDITLQCCSLCSARTIFRENFKIYSLRSK